MHTFKEAVALIDIAKDNGYTDILLSDEHGVVAIYRYAFTYAIISDINEYGFEDRWCYHSYQAARDALTNWALDWFKGEPQGWHRNPNTGRRRDENGNETINW